MNRQIETTGGQEKQDAHHHEQNPLERSQESSQKSRGSEYKGLRDEAMQSVVEDVHKKLLLTQLVKGVHAISDELKAFRISLETLTDRINAFQAAKPDPRETENRPVINLDFQAYLESRNASQK